MADTTADGMTLAQHGAAVREARVACTEAAADAQAAWFRWWNDPTDENWSSHEQASGTARDTLRALLDLESRRLV